MYNYLRLLCYFYITLQIDLVFVLENINNQRIFINSFLVHRFVLCTINYLPSTFNLNERKNKAGTISAK